ncbi:MAG TPA: nucleotidyltransferase family protein [bacterium]|nr:nucleotidyltransferase family protein [bacterium]
MKPAAKIAGVILAAGASSRMGHPKAMLRLDDGATLLSSQASLLSKAGCSVVAAVVGSMAEDIRAGNVELEVLWAKNENWRAGQFSSVQVGLSAVKKAGAKRALVLPVDVAGVRVETIEAIIETSLRNPHAEAVLPEFEGRGGHPVCFSMAAVDRILEMDPADLNSRLDSFIRTSTTAIRLPVNDPRVVRNVNTPEEWEAYRRGERT